MGNTYKNFADADVICPFYRGMASTGYILRCEGAIGDSTLCHSFTARKACEGHMERYCKSFSYPKCPVSRILEGKYAAR